MCKSFAVFFSPCLLLGRDQIFSDFETFFLGCHPKFPIPGLEKWTIRRSQSHLGFEILPIPWYRSRLSLVNPGLV